MQAELDANRAKKGGEGGAFVGGGEFRRGGHILRFDLCLFPPILAPLLHREKLLLKIFTHIKPEPISLCPYQQRGKFSGWEWLG